MTLLNSAAARSAYNRDSVLSASPARLLTMLYDRLVLDLTRAEAALVAGEQPTAWENLSHADRIVAELASSLRVDLWDGAPGLLDVYRYVAGLIASASLERDPAPVREARSLIEPLRDSWHEAAAQLAGSGARAYAAAAGNDGGDLGVA